MDPSLRAALERKQAERERSDLQKQVVRRSIAVSIGEDDLRYEFRVPRAKLIAEAEQDLGPMEGWQHFGARENAVAMWHIGRGSKPVGDALPWKERFPDVDALLEYIDLLDIQRFGEVFSELLSDDRVSAMSRLLAAAMGVVADAESDELPEELAESVKHLGVVIAELTEPQEPAPEASFRQ